MDLVDRDLELVEWKLAYGPGPSPYELQHPSPERVAELRAMGYHAYLRTPEWREKRRLAIDAADHRCERCGILEGQAILDAHHRTYEHLGYERPDDLEILCRACHGSEHGR